MGIHGNATCVMAYENAKGWLIGEEGRGMNNMFVVMNEARLGTGLQGLAIGDAAYQTAVEFANDRLQGRAAGCAGADNHQPPSAAQGRGGVIDQAGHVRQAGVDGVGNLPAVGVQQHQHVIGGKSIDAAGIRVASFRH